MKTILISKTGQINGRGSDKWKWVSQLTPAERAHVKNGGIVLIPDNNKRSGATHKIVTYWGGKYGHRNAPLDVILSTKN